MYICRMESILTCLLKSILEFHKGQFLVLCIYTILLDFPCLFILPMIQVFQISTIAYVTLTKLWNNDLKELSFWFNANKIALSTEKTEIILFKTRSKNYADLKIKLCRKIIHASLYVKYISVHINENLNSKTHMNKCSTKLIKGNAMLPKLWHFVNKDILLSVYYAIFYSHLAYLCLVWGQAKFSFLNHFTTKESHQKVESFME